MSKSRAAALLFVVLLIIPACAKISPFNINLFPFLDEGYIYGEIVATGAPIDIGPLSQFIPDLPPVSFPLNDVRISLQFDLSANTESIVSARIETSMTTEPVPLDPALDVSAVADINLYVSGGSAASLFTEENKVPLGQSIIGSSSVIDLAADLRDSQLVSLKGDGIYIGIEFTNLVATVDNTSASSVLFNGFSWELASLRILGMAETGF